MKYSKFKSGLLFLLCSWMSLGLVSCGDHGDNQRMSSLQEWMRPNGKCKVLSTTAMVGDVVARVGGDAIDHISLIMGEIDPHSYELVKGDDEKLSLADLLFYNGLGLEHGASLRYRIEKHPHAVALGDSIKDLHPEKILYREGRVDPHIWMDMELWSVAIDAIVQALARAVPGEEEAFRGRGELLKEEILSTHREIQEKMRSIPAAKRFLVTSHDAFHYFTRAYLADKEELEKEEWKERCHAPEGLAPDGQISPADIQSIVHHLLSYRIESVFAESNVSPDTLRKIIEACGKKSLHVRMAKEPLYGDAMGSSSSYRAMMTKNAEVLAITWLEEDKK